MLPPILHNYVNGYVLKFWVKKKPAQADLLFPHTVDHKRGELNKFLFELMM